MKTDIVFVLPSVCKPLPYLIVDSICQQFACADLYSISVFVTTSYRTPQSQPEEPVLPSRFFIMHVARIAVGQYHAVKCVVGFVCL